MKKIKVISVVGARPNFVKIAPLIRELQKYRNVINLLVHTGQHYTDYMSHFFFRDFRLPKCINLSVGSLPRTKQIAIIMKKFKKVLLKENPDLIIVVGDVNSTLACALAASRMGIRVAHVEAGLRSFDNSMPEEINRILTDRVSDYLFTTEPSAMKNLKKEKISSEKIFFVGNVMIDSLTRHIKKAKKREIAKKLNLVKKGYALLTLHRPCNVDDKKELRKIIKMLNKIQEAISVAYPVHPRTIKMLKYFGYWKMLESLPNLILTKPLGYIDFLSLMLDSKFVMTDSGGIQEETTYLGIPCFTLRKNTERPITITHGTNTIIGSDYNKLLKLVEKGVYKKRKRRLKYWDGNTAKRIVRILLRTLSG